MSAPTAGQTLKQVDPIRYYSTLFARADIRADLYTLYEFDMEIRKIARAVREPMAGEIRLQWWRDVFLGERGDEAASSPGAQAILDLVQRHALPVASLEAYLDGRIFDLYQDQMEDQQAFEAYAGQTDGTILQFASIISDLNEARSAAEMNGFLACANALWTRSIVPFTAGSEAGAHYLPPMDPNNPYLMDTDINSKRLRATALADHYLDKAHEQAEQHRLESLHHIYLPFDLVSKNISKLKAGAFSVKEPQTFQQIWQLWRASRKWPCF